MDSTAAVAASPEKCGSPTSSAPEAKPASSMRTTVPPLPGKFNTDKENEANTTFVEATPAAAQKKNAMSSPKPYDKALTGGQTVSPRLTRSAHKRAQTKQAMDSLALLKNNSSSSSDDDDEDDEEVQNPRPKSVEFHQFNRYDEWEQQRTAKRARHSSSSSSSSATNHEDLEQMTPDQVRRITTEKLQGSKVSDSIQQLECVARLELEIKKKEKLLKQMNETKDSLEVQLGQSRDENGVLVKQIQELKGRIEEVKGGELKESQQQLGDMAVENEQTSAKLEQKENEFLQAVDNMEVESKKKVAIESKLTSVSSQKESLLSENESLAMELNVVKDQTSQLQHQATFIDLTESSSDEEMSSSSDEEMSIDESDESSDDNEFSDSEEAVDNTTGSESAEVQMARTYHVVNFNGNTAEQQLISHAGKAPKAGAVQRTELKISNSGSLKIAPASEITRKDIVNADGMVLWVSKCDEYGLEYKIANPFAKDGKVKYQDPLPLNEGDNFLIPPHNHFVVENTSSESDAILFYTLL